MASVGAWRNWVLAVASAGLLAAACTPEKRHYGDAGEQGEGGQGGGCSSAIFCDDFESATAAMEPGAPWKVQNENGITATIDDTKAASGKQSVKITVGAGENYKAVRLDYSDKLPPTPNVVYGRMRFFLESAPETSTHWNIIAGEGKVKTGEGYTAVYRYGGYEPVMVGNSFVGSQLMANYDTPEFYKTPPVGPGSDCWQHDATQTVVPVGEWRCVEWKFDGENDEMQLWLDEVELPGMHVKQKGEGCSNQEATYPWTAPAFERILIGWESCCGYDNERTIWIDDVVFSETPIGCQ